MNLISSKDNVAVKQLKRQLEAPKRSDDIIVLEGIHLVQAFFESGLVAERIWVAQGALHKLEIQALLQDTKSRVSVLSDEVFRSVSTLTQGESILCEVAKPSAQAPDLTANAVLLDSVQDTGNLGSILRSAAAVGVRDIYLNHTCANPFAPKVLRSGVGAHFSLNIVDSVDLFNTMASLKVNAVQVLATDLQSPKSIYQLALHQPTAWLFGSEGSGVSPDLLAQASTSALIPMVSGESLNVAAATAVCLFEMMRQQSSR